MARISGVDLPKNKRGEIGLTYIYGIGKSTAQKILADANVDKDKKVHEWNDDEINAIRLAITENYKVEGELRTEVQYDGHWMYTRNPSPTWITSKMTAN